MLIVFLLIEIVCPVGGARVMVKGWVVKGVVVR